MIPLFKVAMSERASKLVAETLASGYIGQGPRVEEFEAELFQIMGTTNLLTVNSGTSGLHLALHLLKAPDGAWPGLQPGDEALTPSLTCTATNWPILANGLGIRWLDADPTTANLCLDDLERKLSPKTKVVMVVHWGGYAVDMVRLDAILEAAAPRLGFKPMVIEDCAHAWRSTLHGRTVGSFGNLSVFSFQAIKHLTAGDGGMLVTPNAELKRRGKLLRWYGIDRDDPRGDFRCENDVEEWGFKFHMNDINASIGLANLELADKCVARHRENAAFYNQTLAEMDGVELLNYTPDRESAYWIYTIKVDRRDDFMRRLTDAGIMVSRVHERNDMHTTVAEYHTSLPQLDVFIDKMVCIPVGWWVTDEDRNHIAETIRAGW